MLAQLLNSKLDPNLKFKVLDMVDPRPLKKVDQLDPVNNSYDGQKIKEFILADD